MSKVQPAQSAEDLRAEIVRLGPWHLDVDVTPELSTAAFLDAPADTYDAEALGAVSFISPREYFRDLIADLYPGGLAGRAVLDCACNCGGYLFWAKELGAGRCFGFDVRQHWIEQARFLARRRLWPSGGIDFKVRDLYDVPDLGLEPFDITIFKGIFYHLPDPITGLKLAADLTNELLVLNTATTEGPANTLVCSQESDTFLMSGVHRLNWFPSGEGVLRRILAWCGFPYARVTTFQERIDGPIGRIEILASRREETLGDFDARRAQALQF